MSGGGGGYQLDPEALERITRGINQAMDELKDFGFDIEANLGRGFGDLDLAGLEVGDAGLHQVFGDFCERWGWGVRSLMQDANGFAERLNLSAGLYHEQEQYASNTLKGHHHLEPHRHRLHPPPLPRPIPRPRNRPPLQLLPPLRPRNRPLDPRRPRSRRPSRSLGRVRHCLEVLMVGGRVAYETRPPSCATIEGTVSDLVTR